MINAAQRQESCVFQRIDGHTITAVIDKAVYGRNALLRTCYWYTDKLYIFISVEDSGKFRIRFRSQNDQAIEVETLAARFMNDLLENELRVQIAKETENVRDMLVAKALGFSRPT
jgi:His-Xaa-Ser system protein HxsD